MKVVFAEIAKIELDDAYAYYELEMSRLGVRFKEEVRKAAIRIAEFPTAWSIERGEIRKCLLHSSGLSVHAVLTGAHRGAPLQVN
jgi:hypothetical protein